MQLSDGTLKQWAFQTSGTLRVMIFVICLGSSGLGGPSWSGIACSQEKPSGKAASVLEVPHCTISLIDRVTLAADRAGILGLLPYEEGDEVAAEKLVAQLINQEAAARLELATVAADSEIAIRVAEKTRDVAEAELLQAEDLNRKREVYTAFEIRRLRLNLDQTVLEREKAVHEQQLKRLEQAVAQAQLEQHDVKSTLTGTVVRVFNQGGEAVQQGEPLLEIASDKRLRIEGYVPVREVRQLRIGDEVQVELSDDTIAGSPLTGKLRFIDLTVQSVTQEVRIWAEVDNTTQTLKPGQLATMHIRIR